MAVVEKGVFPWLNERLRLEGKTLTIGSEKEGSGQEEAWSVH